VKGDPGRSTVLTANANGEKPGANNSAAEKMALKVFRMTMPAAG
jgi:hypothetical protein